MTRKIGQKTYKAQTLEADMEIFDQREVVYSLALYGIPGIKFRINESVGYMTLNNTGIFQYASEEHPITSLKFVNDFELQGHHFLTIDYIYTTSIEEGDNNG